jgi:hypothetical protein
MMPNLRSFNQPAVSVSRTRRLRTSLIAPLPCSLATVGAQPLAPQGGLEMMRGQQEIFVRRLRGTSAAAQPT